ncbi:MAG: sensor histidine kinase, partial [Solirubrobacteraceae bacterium]
ADARAGGRVVEFVVEGERRSLPDGVELAAYRVLQHALVAVRGAYEEPLTLRVRYLDDALELEVRGFEAERSTADIAVLAARERVRVQGGTLSDERPLHGRRTLRARFPVAASA